MKSFLFAFCLLFGSPVFASQEAYYDCVRDLEKNTDLGRKFFMRVSGVQPWVKPEHDPIEMERLGVEAGKDFDEMPEARNLALRIFPRNDEKTRRELFVQRAKDAYLLRLAEEEASHFLAIRDRTCSRYLR